MNATSSGRVILVLSLAFLAAVARADDPKTAVAARSDVADYHIGVEDQLRVVVWREPEISLTAKVRPDGRITVPLVNDIDVVGRTTDQVRADLTEKLSNFVREPRVTVIVEQINSFRVYFVGEVNQQGALQFYSPIRVLQAIATAGGPTEFANKKDITLVRDQGEGEQRIPIDYRKLLAGDASQENVFLRPGDTLIFN